MADTLSAIKGWRSRFTANKLTATWACLFVVYVGFRFAKIDDANITNAFVTVTGFFVGNLGMSQTKKSAEKAAKVEEKADRAVSVAEEAAAATGSMPPIIEDPHTGELRAQKPPKIAREDDDHA